jgi:hypothetical protein
MSDFSASSKNGSLGDRIYSLVRHNVEFVAINPSPTGNRCIPPEPLRVPTTFKGSPH